MNSSNVVVLYNNVKFFNDWPLPDIVVSKAKRHHWITSNSDPTSSLRQKDKFCTPHIRQMLNKHLRFCHSSSPPFGHTTSSHK